MGTHRTPLDHVVEVGLQLGSRDPVAGGRGERGGGDQERGPDRVRHALPDRGCDFLDQVKRSDATRPAQGWINCDDTAR